MNQCWKEAMCCRPKSDEALSAARIDTLTTPND